MSDIANACQEKQNTKREKTPMTISYLSHRVPDVPSDQKEAAEMAKAIRKLRWIGNEDEARMLELQLRRTALADRPSILSEPFCTD
jgi:hypothetical protein